MKVYFERWLLLRKYEFCVFAAGALFLLFPLSFFLEKQILKFCHLMLAIVLSFYACEKLSHPEEAGFRQFLKQNGNSVFLYFLSFFLILALVLFPSVIVQAALGQRLFWAELLALAGFCTYGQNKKVGGLIAFLALLLGVFS